MEESVDYFQRMAQTDLTMLRGEVIITDDLQTLLTEIDVVEQHQADRLYQAYAVLGPMLEAYKAGNKEAFSEEYWNSGRDFRYKVAHDVDALRAEARERVAAGENKIRLNYPEYSAFPWDKEA